MQSVLTIINLAVPPPLLKACQWQPISLLRRRIDGYILSAAPSRIKTKIHDLLVEFCVCQSVLPIFSLQHVLITIGDLAGHALKGCVS